METEDLRRALLQRYSRPADLGRYVVAFEVRSAAGFDAPRTADAIVMDTWPSKGLHLHGYEFKRSRSDLARELTSPEKSSFLARMEGSYPKGGDYSGR